LEGTVEETVLLVVRLPRKGGESARLDTGSAETNMSAVMVRTSAFILLPPGSRARAYPHLTTLAAKEFPAAKFASEERKKAGIA
jgi:hypothetical protein